MCLRWVRDRRESARETKGPPPGSDLISQVLRDRLAGASIRARIVPVFGSTMNPHLGGAARVRWVMRHRARPLLESGFRCRRLRISALQVSTSDLGPGSTRRPRSRQVLSTPAQERKTASMPDAMNLLVRTKSECPQPRGDEIERPRLAALLDDAGNRRLVLIVAPGGYGKTSLALAWPARLRAPGRQVAWFSIDRDDNLGEVFFRYVLLALGKAGVDLSEILRRLDFESSLVRPQTAAALLSNALAEFDDDLTLIFDDYHLITNAEIHTGVQYLLAHAPQNLRLVLISREVPPLSVAVLVGRGVAVQIDAAVALDEEETARLLADAQVDPLVLGAAGRIRAATDGWVAGIRLALAALREADDARSWLDAFPSSVHSITEYLDQSAQQWPPGVVHFAQRLAIVDRFTKPLAIAIGGVAAGAQYLDAILARALLLRPLDAERRTWRFHPLLLEYLRARAPL